MGGGEAQQWAAVVIVLLTMMMTIWFFCGVMVVAILKMISAIYPHGGGSTATVHPTRSVSQTR